MKERKYDFSEACQTLGQLLRTEFQEKWTHVRFLEHYSAFCEGETYQRLTGPSRDWLSGMVCGAHLVLDTQLVTRNGKTYWRDSEIER